MTITLHKNIKNRNVQGVIPHGLLLSEIQQFIQDKNVVQEYYNITFNTLFYFIHLINGDRIDVKLV